MLMTRKQTPPEVKPKETWLERAISTAKFHFFKVKSHPKWVLKDTAWALNRSLGSVSQDLLVVSWLKTHYDEIYSCKNLQDALIFIRRKKKELNTDISHLD